MDQNSKELFALAAWIQTFPEFDVTVYNGSETPADAERLSQSFSSLTVTRAVSSIAETICGVSIVKSLSEGEDDAVVEQIWNSLHIMTSARARPNPTPASNVKLEVLGNLLDCAVQAPSKDQRRIYIGRIMELKKSTQKIIMAMIERRAGRNRTPKKTPSSRQKTPQKTPPSRQSAQKTNSSTASAAKTPPRNYLSAQQAVERLSCTSAGSVVGTPPASAAKNMQTPFQNSEVKSALKSCQSGDRSVRSRSVVFDTPCSSSLTPNRKQEPVGLFSPGTMDSPGQMEILLRQLQQKNECLQQTVNQYKQREEEHNKKVEEMETEHRQTMMKVEAKNLDRVQDLKRDFEERMEELQKKLNEAQIQARKGVTAINELKAAKDELEVMNHSNAALAETTEKLRKYKDKVTELQDIKEALKREQEAHGRSVDEIVRLENEVQQLAPVKRQVEDYKIRAIEAEVKLVECQDYLRRMEQQVNDQSAKNEHLFKDAILQKEQMEEMQRRILQDTQQAMDTIAVNGVGDGISELNPQTKEELIRLRNENLQLRAFQAKRTEDAVQHLEERYDDAKRLADRYKEEYLGTKDTLGETQAALADSQQRESELQGRVKKWKSSYEEVEKRCSVLKEQLESCEKQLEQTTMSLQHSEVQNKKLRDDVNEWIQKKNHADLVASDRLEDLEKTMQELEHTRAILRTAENNAEQLRCDMEGLEVDVAEHSSKLEATQEELEATAWKLSETQNKLAEKERQVTSLNGSVQKLQKQQAALEEKLENEESLRREEAEEAQQSLEATRNLLESKNRKEQEEFQANMTKLLDDERKAYRAKDEEANRQLEQQNQEWHEKYNELQERFTTTLKHSRQEAQERIEFIQNEHKEELTQKDKEKSEELDKIVRKGRSMLDEAKTKATEEYRKLDDECRELDDKCCRLENEKTELENLLRGKISFLKQQLAFSSGQVSDMTREIEEYLEQVKTLEREKFKLNEENEQYRRQLGGRYGSDGKFQSQLEKLQKEYSVVVDENRRLKKQTRCGAALDMALGSITESSEGEDNGGSYRRGGAVDRRAMTQLRREYEERIEALNDEKRELLMKNSAASTDVHKAEKRVWEKEQEISKLKADNTTLKLKLTRAEFASEHQSNGESHHLSENRTPLKNSSPVLISTGSPGIDRARKLKAEQEDRLRSQFPSFKRLQGTPPRQMRPPTQLDTAITNGQEPHSSKKVLSPSRKHDQDANVNPFLKGLPQVIPSQTVQRQAGTSSSKMNSDASKQLSATDEQQNPSSIVDYTQMDMHRKGDDSKPECQQS